MINIIHTPCKNCTFATYENKTQVGCALKYIDVYKKNGQEIIEVYDEDKEFFVVNNKKCPGYREQKWFDSMGITKATIEEKIELFHKYNQISFLLVINLLTLNKKQFIELCQQILALKISPKKIIFVRYPESYSKDSFPYIYLKETIDNYLKNIPWKIQTIVDPQISYEFMLQSIVSTNKKYRFVASISRFNTDISEVIERANKIVIDDLGSFMILSNANKTSILFSSVVYRYSMFMNNINILMDENQYNYI